MQGGAPSDKGRIGKHGHSKSEGDPSHLKKKIIIFIVITISSIHVQAMAFIFSFLR